MNRTRQLQKTILSTADVARLFSVTETTVKRWADDGTLKCQKTPGGHRKFDIRSVVEFATNQGFDPIGALELAEGDSHALSIQLGVLTNDYAKLTEAFIHKALSPDKTDLHRFLSYMYQYRVPLAEIYDNVLVPGMAEIGERWARGEIGINHEHRASYETLDALAKLQAEILVKPANNLSVVCACPGEEQHEIGLRCAANLFESEGWNVHYLGGRIPVESILSAVKEVKPRVVCVSVSMHSDEKSIKHWLKQLHAATQRHNVLLVVGGSGAEYRFVEQHLTDKVAKSGKELVDFIAEVAHQAREQTVSYS